MSIQLRSRAANRSREAARFIVDNSVWARLSNSQQVRAAFVDLVNLHSPASIMGCPPVVAEAGFSARTGAAHTRVTHELTAFPDCPKTPSSTDVLELQDRLWNGGLPRSVGAIETVIAAYAIRDDATAFHYERDFEHVASVAPGFRPAWVVPRGTIV